MTITAFIGVVDFRLTIRALGCAVQRKARARYAYTPPWPFYDVQSGKERTRDMAMSLGLDLLAVGSLDRNRIAATPGHRRYWASVDQLLAIGVLRTEIYEKLRGLIDSDARRQDVANRKRVGLPVPSVYDADAL